MRQQIVDCVHSYPGAVHVYSGWRNTPRVFAAYRAARKDPLARHVVVAEQFRGYGLKGWTRIPWAFIQTLQYRKTLSAILAIGTVGERFYKKIGFPEELVFPFIYQSEENSLASRAGQTSQIADIVFIGSLNRRKGVDVLLRSLANVQHLNWRLHVVGEGPLKVRLIEFSKKLRIHDRTQFLGVIPHAQVVDKIASCDLCVVPSRFDGWGAVTNEALAAGTPVIVSDRAGSSDLVRYSDAGIVYRGSHPVEALSSALSEFLERLPYWRARRPSIRAYAELISGPVVAQYLVDVLGFVILQGQCGRPDVPWMSRGAKVRTAVPFA